METQPTGYRNCSCKIDYVVCVLLSKFWQLLNILAFTIHFKKKRCLLFFAVSSVNVAFTTFTSQSGHTIVFPNVLSSTGGAIVIRMAYSQLLLADFTFFVKITSLRNSDMVFQFILNGSPKTTHLVYGRSYHSFRTSSNAIVLQLNRGDTVWIKMLQNG